MAAFQVWPGFMVMVEIEQIPGNMCHPLLALGYVDLDIRSMEYTPQTSSFNDFEGVNFY